MCGRYYFTRVSDDDKMDAINKAMEKNYPGEYKTGEIFPGDIVPAVIDRQGKIVAVPAGFGFPGYQDNKLILNARSETAAEKKTFADGLRDRRVILPASGFYEWSHHDREKTKYLFTVDAMQTIYLCRIYKLIDGVYRFVILTRPAISDRSPRRRRNHCNGFAYACEKARMRKREKNGREYRKLRMGQADLCGEEQAIILEAETNS